MMDKPQLHVALKLWFNVGMRKTDAITKLGGTVSAAARAIGCSYQAIVKWPDILPPRISDRVEAALWRMSQQRVETMPAAVGENVGA